MEYGRRRYRETAERIYEESSIVNVGVSTSYNAGTRECSITVEAYYVEGLPFGLESNFIQVALVESNVIAYQAGASNSYNHKFILRDLITDQWGDEIEDIEQGSIISRTYITTIDEEFVAENCEIVAFITETKQEVITGAMVPVIDGLHNGEIEADYGRLFGDNSISVVGADQLSSFDLTLINGLNESQDVTLTLNHDAPEGWDVSFTVNEVAYTTSSSITLSPDDVKDVMINVTPNETVGVAHCELVLTSDSYPSKPSKLAEVFVVSGVDNLIVNGSGLNNDILSADFVGVYKDGLSEAGCTTYGAIPGYALEQAADQGLLDNVENIYLNIGGTLPVLTVAQTNVLTSFIDAGGNVLIAGQDFGRDIWGSGAESSAITQKMFCQNYIGCSYLDDGDAGNNNISSTVDSIYSGITGVTLYNAYGGDFDPDEVKSFGDSKEILFYANGKAAGIKNYVGSGKIAYFAFGLEQVQSESERMDLIDRTYRWFEGWEGSSVAQENMFSVEIYPNPASDNIRILNAEGEYTYSIINISGQVVISGNTTESVDVSELSNGVYFIELENTKGISRVKFTKI